MNQAIELTWSIDEKIKTIDDLGIEYDKGYISERMNEMQSLSPREKHKLREHLSNYLNLVYFYKS